MSRGTAKRRHQSGYAGNNGFSDALTLRTSEMSEVNNERGSQRGKWPGKVQASLPPTPSLPIVALGESAPMGGKQRPHPPGVHPTVAWK